MKKIFLIGIGGIGMQALAALYLAQGESVTGSDLRDFPERESLRQKGVQVFVGHAASHLDGSFDLVVYSSAIPPENVELRRARELNLETLKRSQALGEMMREKTGIAVAGTHGKSTTTALVGGILETAGLDPTFVIGAEVRSGHGAVRWGQGQYFLVEACEYDHSFLDLNFQSAIITNIEPDHLDYFGNFEGVKEAFAQFLRRLPTDGFVVAGGDEPVLRKLVDDSQRRAVFYGKNQGNDYLCRPQPLREGKNPVLIESPTGEVLIESFLHLPGEHLLLDATAAAVLALELKIEREVIDRALRSFTPPKRRFEILYQREVTLVDDYGHHPTEIRATLEALRELFPQKRLLVAFQPHQFSRTRLLFQDFAASFKLADLVLVAPIFASRDKREDEQAVSAESLVAAINQISHNAAFVGDLKAIGRYLLGEKRAGDLILTLGAGETNLLAQELVANLERP